MPGNDVSVYSRAVRVFGAESQVRKSVEELTELSMALLRSLDGRANLENIWEEIADVEIMCAQLRIMFGSDCVDEAKLKKLTRLESLVSSKTQ